MSIIGLILPSFSFAQGQTLSPPETTEEAKKIGERFIIESIENLPKMARESWRTDVLPVWQKMWDYFKGFWNLYFAQRVESFWQNIKTNLKIEIEQRKPAIEQEFQKEKQEMKEELPKVSKSLWERFKELIE